MHQRPRLCTTAPRFLITSRPLGFKYSTKGAITISIADMTVPDAKKELIAETEKRVVEIERRYKRGFITNDERYRIVVSEWEKTTKDVTEALQDGLDEFNPIYMMANSGARGSHEPDPSACRYAWTYGKHSRYVRLRFRSSLTSVRDFQYLNTSFPPEAPERVWPTRLSVRLTPVTSQDVLLTYLRMLLSREARLRHPRGYGCTRDQ